ncbi:hypothetical protein C8R43DRAFT_1134337 [Mycena crocata]|nr:hypothetical protein C8R43DRAFT_1134337 [Mycena crocata]
MCLYCASHRLRTPTTRSNRQQPTSRSPLKRFLHRIKKLLTRQPRTPVASPSSVLESIFPWTLCTSLEGYVEWILRKGYADLELACAAEVEEVLLYRHTSNDGDSHSSLRAYREHALIICHLRHPAAPGAGISLMLSQARFCARQRDAPLPEKLYGLEALDPENEPMVTVTTIDSDARLIEIDVRWPQPQVIGQVLTFGGAHPAPKLLDVVAIAQAANEQISGVSGQCHCRAYAVAAYTALKEIFDGTSEPGPGCDPHQIYDEDIKTVVDSFPSAIEQLQTELNRIRINEAEETARRAEQIALIIKKAVAEYELERLAIAAAEVERGERRMTEACVPLEG